MASLDIAGDSIGESNRPYVIAEAGTNFRDDIELANVFIEEAAAAGADAVKFQTHVQEAEMAETAMRELGFGDLYDRLGTYSLSEIQHRELAERCKEFNVTFLSTPFSVEAVELLNELDVPAIKIGSGEFTNFHLLWAAAETGKPLLVSTGMHDWQTIETTYEFLSSHADAFAFLYCISEYPTDPSDFQLDVIDDMRGRFGIPIGFSDHSTGIDAAALAIGRGVDFVEKHFTIDRRLPGGDQEVSIEPDELEHLVRLANLESAVRGSTKAVSENERSLKQWAGHSVVTRKAVEAGEQFSKENLTTKRPGTGIPAKRYFDIVGQTAAESIDADVVLRDEYVSERST